MAELRKSALSLFSGAGIGDVGFRAAGFDFVSMCELEPARAALASANFPVARVFAAGVEESREGIVAHAQSSLGGGNLHLLTCTAPCQGMSKNGQGTLLKNIRAGNRPALDPRNRLILHALDIIRSLRPLWVVFENVIEMRNTLIENRDHDLKYILDIVFDHLSEDYEGWAYDVEFADYGIPQRRQRLITVLTRDRGSISSFRAGHSLIPPATHTRTSISGLAPWVSVRDAIGDFTPLDGREKALAEDPTMPFHRVPVLDPKKYEWIRHTPAGKSAFDNQCVQPTCLFQGNRTHGASYDGEGINRAHRDTPLYCERCGELLPRPYTEEAGTVVATTGQ